MDALRSTSLLIKRMAVQLPGDLAAVDEAVLALARVAEEQGPPVPPQQGRLQQAAEARVDVVPEAPVSPVVAGGLQLPPQIAAPRFQAWRLSTHCWQPA